MKKSDIRQMIREAILRSLTEDEDKKEPGSEQKQPEEAPAPPGPEDTGKSAAEEAHELNLQYAGWGKWADQTGKVVAKTVKGRLVRIEDGGAASAPQSVAATDPYTGEPMDAPVTQGTGNGEDPYTTTPALANGKHMTYSKKELGLEPKSSTTPAGKPGSIDPPKTASGSPVAISVNGKPGVVDKVMNDEAHTTFVTFDDGTFGQFPASEVKLSMPKPGQGSKTSKEPVQGTNDKNPPSTDPVSPTAQPEQEPVQKDDSSMVSGINLTPEQDKEARKIFKEAGIDPYKPQGLNHVSPRWNKGMDTHDVPFDANGEETVQKLLSVIGDPIVMLRWLLKKFQEETPNGKLRIKQYIGIMKDMGLLAGLTGDDTEQEPDDLDAGHFSPDE